MKRFKLILNFFTYYVSSTLNYFFQEEGTQRKEGGKRGRKPGRKAADKVDMKAKLGKKSSEFCFIYVVLEVLSSWTSPGYYYYYCVVSKTSFLLYFFFKYLSAINVILLIRIINCALSNVGL